MTTFPKSFPKYLLLPPLLAWSAALISGAAFAQSTLDDPSAPAVDRGGFSSPNIVLRNHSSANHRMTSSQPRLPQIRSQVLPAQIFNSSKTTGKTAKSNAKLTQGAAVLSAPSVTAAAVDCLAAATPLRSINMKVLILTADGTESVLPAMKQILDYVGIPFDVINTASTDLTSAALCSSSADGYGLGNYQGVLLTTGNLSFYNNATAQYESGLTLAEWQLLWQYEAKYRIRQASFYTYPGSWPDNYGLNAPSATLDTSASPLATRLTTSAPAGSGNPSGVQVFSYLNSANPLTIKNVYAYLGKAVAGAALTPLLQDAAGNAIVSINNYSDGRKGISMTVDGSPYNQHTLALGYGIVNWVLKGLYIGQRKVYLNLQSDDILLPDDIWNPATSSDQSGKIYRMTANDYKQYIAWQTRRNAADGSSHSMEWAFNGFGASSAMPKSDFYPATSDTLTPAIKANQKVFNWVSHTYNHLLLEAPTTYAQTLAELRQNDSMAISLGLTNYVKDSLVTPEISGLNNAEAMRAMNDFGIRYIVSDTSKNCGNRTGLVNAACPRPNAGIYHDLQPTILMIPRYPTNLFYNVCTPTEWVSEYNYIYRSYWGRDLSYAEIVDKESDVILSYLQNYDIRPIMLHQPNQCAYDGVKSLTGDLVDNLMAKYKAMYNLPVISRQQRQIGKLMADRMALNKALAPSSGAALNAKIMLGSAATSTSSIAINNPSAAAVIVPITGVSFGAAANIESYGGQSTSRLTVNPASTLTVTGVAAW